MYFITHNNRFYSWMVHTKPFYRYCITLVGSMAGIGILFGSYTMLETTIKHEQSIVTSLQQQQIHLLEAKQQQEQSANAMNQMQIALQLHLADAKLHQDNVHSSMLFIIEQAQKAGLLLHAYSAEKEADKEWHTKEVGRFDLQGTWEQWSSFLATLQSSKKLIQCSSLQLNHVEGSHFAGNCILSMIKPKQQKS